MSSYMYDMDPKIATEDGAVSGGGLRSGNSKYLLRLNFKGLVVG